MSAGPESVVAAAVEGCAQEPIRVPGAVQPHGVLLALTEPDLSVVVTSANAPDLFDRPGSAAQLVGVRLDDVLDAPDLTALRTGLAGELAELNPLRVHLRRATGDPVPVDVVVHRTGGLLVTEWEPLVGAEQAGAAWHRRLPLVLQRLAATSTVEQLAQALARDVRSLTAFDRVMIYRFDPEWNGEVIAEDRREDLEPFLGLHYPASDIPAQARALYETNWLRLIPDATYQPVPLLPAANDGRSLDLSGAMLRSVSPVHLQYLANMGVVASMSVSLIDGGRLWGLIACHHYRGPHRPSYTDRLAAEFLGRTASLLLGSKVDSADQEQVLQVSRRQAELVAALGRQPRALSAGLTGSDLNVLDLLPAGGAALRIDGRLTCLGSTPAPERIPSLVAGLLALAPDSSGVAGTDRLSSVAAGAADVVDTASGLLAAGVGSGRGDFLAWFRPELLRTVSWGGNPYEAKVLEQGDGLRLTPRRSFEQWTETVRGASAPWLQHEVEAAGQLARHVTELQAHQVAQDNRLAAALQRTLLLERLPTVPGLAVAARYAPSEHDVVGGDWYDLVLLPSGHVAFVLGDVAGHGLAAAAITAQLRHALRAYLLRDEGPGAAMTALNELVGVLLPGEMATAVVAELDPATGSVQVANAGHLPPLLVDTSGGTYLDEGRGPALGLLETGGYDVASVVLAGDDRLVLYSDGLVERRHEDLQDGLQKLRASAQRSDRNPSVVLDDLLEALAPPDTDDVTVLCLGLA